MMRALRSLDELLRGNKTSPEALREGTGHLHVASHAGVSVPLGVVYGLCMGLYAVLAREEPCYAQLAASAVKVPALFLLTLLVTFPSLYVFGALLGARLTPGAMLRVVVAAITVNLAVLASLGPITAFFTLTTTSYPFMKLLNVFFFAISGAIALNFLLTVLRRVEAAAGAPMGGPGEAAPAAEAPAGVQEGAQSAPPVARLVDTARSEGASSGNSVFRVWLLLYMFVGAQMGWVLRPFIGDPELPFSWFRPRGGNVFLDVLRTLGKLFS